MQKNPKKQNNEALVTYCATPTTSSRSSSIVSVRHSYLCSPLFTSHSCGTTSCFPNMSPWGGFPRLSTGVKHTEICFMSGSDPGFPRVTLERCAVCRGEQPTWLTWCYARCFFSSLSSSPACALGWFSPPVQATANHLPLSNPLILHTFPFVLLFSFTHILPCCG